MYVDTCNFDPNNMSESAPEIVLHSNTIINHNMEEELSNFHHNNNAAMEMEQQQQQQLQNEMGFANNMMKPFETHQGTTNWDNTTMNEMQQQLPTPDLLSLFHLPTSVQLPHSSISFTNPKSSPSGGYYHPGSAFGYEALPETLTGGGAAASASVMYDPTIFHLNQLPPQPQPPLFRELLQSLPHGYNLDSGPSLFGNNNEEGEDGSSRQLFENGVMEFSKEMKPFGRGRGGNKATKHFATERQRRVQLNEKFQDLKNLVPNPTKPDRASIVGDAIGYIEELKRTVEELKLLVEKKRCQRERNKRHKTEHDTSAGGDDESCNMKPIVDPHEQSYNNGSLRSSWLQRKSKDTEVDVRIIDDEVTIKLVQRKKINLLLSVSKLLDELQLELYHAAGGHIGNSYSFLFNTKMYEGSSLYASAIANKLIEALDRQYASNPPTSSY